MGLGQVQCVIAYALDRISRDPIAPIAFWDSPNAMNVDLHFVHGPTGETSGNELVEYLRGYMAQMDQL